jgi:hypothetical protein
MSPRSQKGELMLFGSLVSICTLTRLLFSSFRYNSLPLMEPAVGQYDPFLTGACLGSAVRLGLWMLQVVSCPV